MKNIREAFLKLGFSELQLASGRADSTSFSPKNTKKTPINFSLHLTNLVKQGTPIVHTAEEFLEVVNKAKPGSSIIWFDDGLKFPSVSMIAEKERMKTNLIYRINRINTLITFYKTEIQILENKLAQHQAPTISVGINGEASKGSLKPSMPLRKDKVRCPKCGSRDVDAWTLPYIYCFDCHKTYKTEGSGGSAKLNEDVKCGEPLQTVENVRQSRSLATLQMQP